MTDHPKFTVDEVDFHIATITFTEYFDMVTHHMIEQIGEAKIGELIVDFDHDVVSHFVAETVFKFKLLCLKPEYTARFTIALLEEANRNMQLLIALPINDTKH